MLISCESGLIRYVIFKIFENPLEIFKWMNVIYCSVDSFTVKIIVKIFLICWTWSIQILFKGFFYYRFLFFYYGWLFYFWSEFLSTWFSDHWFKNLILFIVWILILLWEMLFLKKLKKRFKKFIRCLNSKRTSGKVLFDFLIVTNW